MRIKDPVRFVQKSRFDDYKKGDEGFIHRVFSLFPDSTEDIYIVRLGDYLSNGPLVWCTNKDITLWNQLSLF